jgi:hypothetical protein
MATQDIDASGQPRSSGKRFLRRSSGYRIRALGRALMAGTTRLDRGSGGLSACTGRLSSVQIAEARRVPAVIRWQLGVSRRFHVMDLGPGQSFFWCEAAAVTPAFLRRPTPTSMVLAGERLTKVFEVGSRQREAKGRRQISNEGHDGAEPAPQRAPSTLRCEPQHGNCGGVCLEKQILRNFVIAIAVR